MVRRQRKWLLCCVAGALLFAGAAWIFRLFSPPASAPPPLAVPRVAEAGSGPPPHGGSRRAPDGPQTGRQNILLLGIDARTDGEQTRSDVMILASLDPQIESLSLLSIPRDTRVEIPGRGLDKINHAHAFGGVSLAMQTVADAFQVPIHHWARVDMPGLLKLADVLGPVTVKVPEPLTLRNGEPLTAGSHQMDSRHLLMYLRERYSDPRGDIGRSERAADFLVEVGRQMAPRVSVTDAPKLFALINQYVQTDLRSQESVGLLRLAASRKLTVRKGTVQGHGAVLDGIWYYQVDWPATEQVLTSLHLWPRPVALSQQDLERRLQ